jgi:hypothetical protein
MKLTAETLIAADRETVWRFTQTPACHVKWDLRFSDIDYLPRGSAGEPQRFRYAMRLGAGLAIQGWGETIGRPDRATSALRFGSVDAKSLIREGAGSWTYAGHDGTTRFSTVYDYATRYGLFGRVLDLAFRPLMIWATRWSFDRLRLWIEDGIRPGIALGLWLLKVVVRSALAATWIYEGLIPKILAQRADEIALVRDSRLYAGAPSDTLAALGLAEIAFGFWLLCGRAERVAAIVSTAGICSLAALVVSLHPAALTDPFGGISKNLGLLGCGAVVWMLSECSPIASRAKPMRHGKAGPRAPSPRALPARPPRAPSPRASLSTLSPGHSRTDSPLAQALSADELRRLAPLVRAHLTPAMGIHRYRGSRTASGGSAVCADGSRLRFSGREAGCPRSFRRPVRRFRSKSSIASFQARMALHG